MRVEAGKYVGLGGGAFAVKCLECGEEATFSWGAVGPLYAPPVLRANGYRMTGKAFGARWICPDCDIGSDRDGGDPSGAPCEASQSGDAEGSASPNPLLSGDSPNG